MVSPTYLNQHEDLLYRQKYLQQNTEKNRMFPTPNTKISARSARSQSVICFQLAIIIKKGHAHDSAPSTPDKGSVRNFNGRISFYHCWRSNRRPLFAQTQELPGALYPGHPAGALRRAHGPHPYIRGRALMRARRGTRMDIFRPLPLFLFWMVLPIPISMIEKNYTHAPPPPPLINFFEPAEWFKENFKHPPPLKNPGYAPAPWERIQIKSFAVLILVVHIDNFTMCLTFSPEKFQVQIPSLFLSAIR